MGYLDKKKGINPYVLCVFSFSSFKLLRTCSKKRNGALCEFLSLYSFLPPCKTQSKTEAIYLSMCMCCKINLRGKKKKHGLLTCDSLCNCIRSKNLWKTVQSFCIVSFVAAWIDSKGCRFRSQLILWGKPLKFDEVE